MGEFCGLYYKLHYICQNNQDAEFAIAIRTIAMGKGYGWFAMHEIMKYAFDVLHLESVYWCVSKNNKRACKFYDKHMFNQMLDIDLKLKEKYGFNDSLRWYVVHNNDNLSLLNRDKVLDCDILKIKTFSTGDKGQLSFFEGKKDIPFNIKRIYYITNVKEGQRRGFHAHKNLKQLLVCVSGKINIILDNGVSRNEILLDDSSIGILIEKPIWREMQWIETNSVLFVAASDYYSEEDYIRDYSEYLKFMSKK